MPPTKRTAKEEAEFMSDLLAGLDHDFFTALPSPDPSPIKKPTIIDFTSPVKHKPKKATTISSARVFSVSAEDVNTAALVDGADNWDWGDMECDFLSPKKTRAVKAMNPTEKSPVVDKYVRETCTRCIVETVTESQEDSRFQKKLTVKLDPGEERRSVVLCDDWAHTDLHVGDTINILGLFAPLPPTPSLPTSAPSPIATITLTSKSNLLILHPDLLLTATALSNASQCSRKPLLSALIRSSSDTTPSLVWGNMLHEVVQTCLKENTWEETWVDGLIRKVVNKGIGELVKISIGVEEAIREVKARSKGLKVFSERYMSQMPKPEAILSNTRSKDSEASLLAITQLHDVEEDIWSPTYGLKGKLDAIVQTIISTPPPRSPFPPTAVSRHTTSPMPFEIKTGRAVAGMEHRAQTMLYTLLVSERYGVSVQEGLLYYTQNEEVVRVPRGWNEVRGLIGGRNELTAYMMKRMRNKNLSYKGEGQAGNIEELEESFLPPTIDDERVCKRCYELDTCMLYRKAVEHVDDDSSPIADTYNMKTGHLTPSQTSFFMKWENLIAMEEQDLVRFRKELWTMGAKEREAKGRCFGGMVLDGAYRIPASPLKDTGKIHQFTYRFVRQESGSRDAGSLLSGHMSIGDAVTVSVEPDLLAFAKGFILELEPEKVVLGVDHEVGMHVVKARLAGRGGESNAKVVFRIDKDELFGGMGRIRDNLAKLFYAGGDTRRLELVVDLRIPEFRSVDTRLPPSVPKTLNANQRHAIDKVLCAQDYALILGMPGTGKTTVIAAIIKTLVAMGKSVLLTSYTHSAVDTILGKLAGEEERNILRLGNVDKVHPDVRKYTLAARTTPTSIEQLERQIMTPPIVATTCLSIDHALFSRRTFDYCIVDEASQITLPTCLGPLRFADKFVLVGDHFQLPPLVRNKEARKGGLDVSLFRRLSDAHPIAVVDLTHQYRMNEDIMLLSNKLIYSDRLRCGSEVVANRSLVLPDPKFIRGIHASGKSACGGGCWMEKLMSESCKAIFVDTDAVPANDSRVGDLVQNTVEASLAHQVTEAFLSSGVRQDQIGIISLYRQQIKVLSHLLQDRKGVEVLTADRSQGRDKDCVIISMVKSNDAGQIGDLVKDWRRVNVSFTRARSKLVIFGSHKTLQAAPLLAEFFSLMEGQGWILKLPPNAHLMHPVPHSNVVAPNKRAAEDMDGKENSVAARATKKAKKSRTEEGLLRGRPILQDLVNEGKQSSSL